MPSAHLSNQRVVDPVLTTVARGYKNAALIHEQLFPVVSVDKEGLRVPVFGKGVFATFDTVRAVAAKSNVLTREKTGLMSLTLDEHDLSAPVDYREQHESMFNEMAKATRRVVNGVQLSKEVAAAKLLTDASLYGDATKALTGDKSWAGKGDPLVDLEEAAETVRRRTGLRPNTLVIGSGVMPLLRFHPAFKGYLGSSERKKVTSEVLKDALEIPTVITGSAVRLADNDKKDANARVVDVWGNHVWLGYVSPPGADGEGADENEPSFGYQFRLRGMPVADQYPGEGGKIVYSRYTDLFKLAVVGSDCGFLFTSVGDK